ncbi:unnamed protein product [Linum tenue]|uniref:DUF538 family protein n=3 Tax=Linum tenue TaxID=586396 RepID=A0AAV0R171_9ROSI|nr:unnamed protein product [Linum tenue]
MADPKQGGSVTKGHEEAMKMAVSLLKEFGLPEGLLPLDDVAEAGFVKETGFFWIVQRKATKHRFELVGKQVSYDVEVSAYLEKNKVRKMKGVKAKELMALWPPVVEIVVDHPPTGKVRFRSLGGVAMAFPVHAFAAGQ